MGSRPGVIRALFSSAEFLTTTDFVELELLLLGSCTIWIISTSSPLEYSTGSPLSLGVD